GSDRMVEPRQADARGRLRASHWTVLQQRSRRTMMRETVLQIGTLWWREITRFRRQRSRIIGSVVQPFIFWVFLGVGFNASFRPPGMPPEMSFVQYFYPGVIVLVLLFTAIFATISTVEDRKAGFMQGVLVSPISR